MLTMRIHERLNEAFSPKTVKIGDQVWMAENLDIDDGGRGIKVRDGNIYYTWEAAMRIASKLDGWHLPTIDEFKSLVKFAGDKPGNKLKSKDGWVDVAWRGLDTKGTDEFGFNALPVGYIDSAGWNLPEYEAAFWSSTSRDKEYADSVTLYHDLSKVGFAKNWTRLLFSVRLIED